MLSLDALRCAAFGAAVLKSGEAGAVLGRVSVDAIGVESLAEDEDGLAMFAVLAGLFGKTDVGGEREIAGGFGQRKWKPSVVDQRFAPEEWMV